MTAMGHSFRTEIESRSLGNPTFLSRHLDALCPPTQEEDDWMEQELEKARQQRGSFYRKLANSRSTSMRDLDDLGGSRNHSASRGSTERELSGSPTSTSSPPPPVPEPHSSWRFYTSYDNGEWKRHCVPAQKQEEEISMKSPNSEKEKEISPAYESHLKKYRQARNALFDRPTRRFAASNSPQGETTTVRVVSRGNPGALRSALGGSTNRLPFGGSTPDIRFKNIREPAMSNATSLPSQYREETTTSETITTVHGPEITEPSRPVVEKPASVHTSPTRPRHNNMGFKEKIIVPTKYKTETEKVEAATKKQVSAAKVEMNGKPDDAKPSVALPRESNTHEPSFLGSTFEKFNFRGSPLIKPTFTEYSSSSKRKPMFGDSLGMNSANGAKRRPVFDSNSQPLSSSDSRIAMGSNDMLYSSWPAFQNSTPVHVETKTYSSTEKRSLPFGSPVERTITVKSAPALEKPIPQFEKPRSVIQPPEENNITLGLTENSAFSVPSKSRPQSFPIELNSTSNGEKVIYSRIHQNVVKSPEPKTRGDGVVFIPVVRIQGSSQGGDRVTGNDSNVSVSALNKPTDPLTGCPILELLEDSGGGEGNTNGFSDQSPGGIATQRPLRKPDSTRNNDALNIDNRDVNNNSSEVRNMPFRDFTTENDCNDKENENASVSGSNEERIVLPSTKRVNPVFLSDGSSQRRSPLSSSSLLNLMSKSEERIFKTGERLPSGEKIIIPSKYRQKNGSSALSSNGISKSATDISFSGALSPHASNNGLSSSTRQPENLSSSSSRLDQGKERLGSGLLHGSDTEVSSIVREKREKPIFPSDVNRKNAEDDSRLPKPFYSGQPTMKTSESKDSPDGGNDSGVNLDSSQNDSSPKRDASFSSPESRRNDSRDGDGGISMDSGGPAQKQKTTSRGWVIVREYEC